MSKLHFSEHAEPMRFMAASTAPLGGVLLALLALWMAAVPPSLHEIGFDLPGDGCLGVTGPEGPPVHIVIIDQAGDVTWDGEVLADRAALERRMSAIGAEAIAQQPAIHVVPHKWARYGAFMAVMVAAQRNGVALVDLIGEGPMRIRGVPADAPRVIDHL
ncbi:ExbD/TolR family protein [Roseateles noduli]|uniref:ExbD/TolR family protein n=1 Tax=Roseateles noduli TaxID=2052484 RepID=UPI003D65C1D1